MFLGEERAPHKRCSQSVEKILRSRIFSFLCIRLYVIEKEDSNERNPSGVSFVFVQVAWRKTKFFDKLRAPHKRCSFVSYECRGGKSRRSLPLLYYSSLSAATSKRLVAAAMAREVSLLLIIFFVLIIKLLSFGELQRGAFGNHPNSLPKSPFFSGTGWESAETNS